MRAVEPLIGALNGSEDYVKYAAVEALGKLNNVCAVEPLIKALSGGAAGVRSVAAEALGKLSDKRAVEPLIEALGDHNDEMRRVVAESLTKLGESKWKGIFRGNDEDWARLAVSGEKRAFEWLTNILDHWSNSSAARAAAEALAELGDSRSVTPLINALSKGNWSCRRAAAEGLAVLAVRHPAWLGKHWQDVRVRATQPHGDVHSSSDCTHTDQGIGIDFPPTPPGLDF
jgi:HEAT repeat protein